MKFLRKTVRLFAIPSIIGLVYIFTISFLMLNVDITTKEGLELYSNLNTNYLNILFIVSCLSLIIFISVTLSMAMEDSLWKSSEELFELKESAFEQKRFYIREKNELNYTKSMYLKKIEELDRLIIYIKSVLKDKKDERFMLIAEREQEKKE